MLEFLKDKNSAPWWLLVLIEVLRAIAEYLSSTNF